MPVGTETLCIHPAFVSRCGVLLYLSSTTHRQSSVPPAAPLSSMSPCFKKKKKKRNSYIATSYQVKLALVLSKPITVRHHFASASRCVADS